MKKRLLAQMIIAAVTVFATTSLWAQVKTDPGVGRISLIHGEVSTQRGDSGDWAAAALNAPLVSGDKISTGAASRAEVQLDYANILRLSERTQANIADLSQSHVQIQVGQGTVNYTVFKQGEAEPEIDTPNVVIHPGHEDGSYRIVVTSDNQTQVIVRKGEAEVSTPQGSTQVKKGQLITVAGSGDDTQYKIAEAPDKDDWDNWNKSRDNMIHDAQAWRYTNRQYVGADDLDAYGRWTTVPDYGPVWVPAVGPDWVPYRAGQWVWEPYYGWTWVSYEPWGWAPYHYGRWFYYGSSWAWWPGPVAVAPVWAPAYVSFFGFGGGVGFGFGFGSIGWLPIGPCDTFYPWWGRGYNRFNVVNVTNITNINNVGGVPPLRYGRGYSNLRLVANDPHIQRAVSTVSGDHFGAGRYSPMAATPEMIHNGRMMTGNVPVVPTHASLSASGRPANPATLPRGGQTQHFFGRPASSPQPFANQAAQVHQAIASSGSQSASMAAVTRVNGTARPTNTTMGLEHGTTQRPTAATNSGDAARLSAANSGFTRFGAQAGNGTQHTNSASPNNVPGAGHATQPEPARPVNTDRSGWQRFSNSTAGPGTNRSTTGWTHPGNSYHPSEPASPNGTGGARSVPRPPNASSGNSAGEWQRFNPGSHAASPASPSRGNGGSQWSRVPSSGNSAGGSRSWGTPSRGSYAESARGSYRPPLDMRQPIVTPRSGGGYNPGGYSHSGGGYSGGSSGGGRSSGGSGGHSSGGGSPHASGGHSR